MIKGLMALVASGAFVLPAAAQNMNGTSTQLMMVEYTSPMLPPANYKGQWWTSPDNCEYSRAGRPGETVWYLIVNSAHTKCAGRLIQRAYSDYQ